MRLSLIQELDHRPKIAVTIMQFLRRTPNSRNPCVFYCEGVAGVNFDYRWFCGLADAVAQCLMSKVTYRCRHSKAQPGCSPSNRTAPLTICQPGAPTWRGPARIVGAGPMAIRLTLARLPSVSAR